MTATGNEPPCWVIQAYFTATPSQNTPLLFLGFRVPFRFAEAACAIACSLLAVRPAWRSRRTDRAAGQTSCAKPEGFGRLRRRLWRLPDRCTSHPPPIGPRRV